MTPTPVSPSTRVSATHQTFCRFCHANCAIEVEVADNVPVGIRGEAADPMFGGYTCMKGRELATAHTHPDRLRRSLKRQPDGCFAPIPTTQALDEIAAKMQDLMRAHGPRAIASYNGTYAFQNSAALPISLAFHKAIGSPMFTTSVTLDQPAKVYLWSRVGAWGGGLHSFRDAEVVLIIGNNVLTSHYSPPGGVPPFNASRRLRDAQAAGLKVICVDPRVSDVARLADMHLQVRPGEDAALLAGMVRVILDEGLHDQAFCQQHVAGVDDIRRAVAPFTPDVVEARAGVPAQAVVEAARLFARAKRGAASTGTGPEMSGQGSLIEHFVECLNILCGRFYREGEESTIPRVLSAVSPRKAQAVTPGRLFGEGFAKSRVRGLTQLGEEMPCTTLADEILMPGDGQVRALLCMGGNPIVAWPNQEKVARAMADLELLVCVDIRQSQTARYAHYILPGQMCLEREDCTTLSEWWYEEPYARYAERLVEPDVELINEWEVYWELAQRLGITLTLPGGALPTDAKPTTFEVLDKATHGCRVPLAEVRAASTRGQRYFPDARALVEPGDPASEARLNLAPADVIAEITAFAAHPKHHNGYSHLLISRRTKQFFNSTGHDIPALRARGATNPAHIHPDDLAALGVTDGDVIAIASPHGAIHGIAKAAPEIKRGVISMAHAFGDWTPENAMSEADVRDRGSSTNRLVDDETDYDPLTGMTRQSAIPVNVSAVPA